MSDKDKSLNKIISMLEAMERSGYLRWTYTCIRDVFIPSYLNRYEDDFLAILAWQDDRFTDRVFITLYHNDDEYKYECKKEV